MQTKHKTKRLKKSFFKKDEQPDFQSMLVQQCEITCESISKFVIFMETRDQELAKDIEQCEKRADKVRRKLIDYVENSFITPLDRHDLFAVSRSIDDITDKIKDLKDFILFFDYRPNTKHMEIARTISSSITYITNAMKHWGNTLTDEFWDNLVKAKKNENNVKRLYWENIEIITSEGSDLRTLAVTRDFSRDLNCLANKTGKAADSISDIRIKAIK